MKTQLLLITLLTLSGIYLSQYKSEENNSISYDSDKIIFQAYQQWKSEYGINFNSEDDEYRFLEFKNSYNEIQEHNSKNDQLILGLNSYSAMSLEEWKDKILLKNRQQIQQNQVDYPKSTVSGISINWLDKGAVMPVTQQGHCGSCWAFSTIAGLSSLRYLVDGVLERMSAQQLVSCIPEKYLDPGAINGCGGSDTRWGYTYTHEHGIETWDQYPYVSGVNGDVPDCHHKDSNSVFFNRGDADEGSEHGYIRLPRGDVYAMKDRIKIQPYSGSVSAGNKIFKHYKAGTILDNSACGTSLDHSIYIVGLHDVENEAPYWTIQNSWGPEWGENGYVRIAVTEGEGICGINLESDVPLSIHQKPTQQQQQLNQY